MACQFMLGYVLLKSVYLQANKLNFFVNNSSFK